LSKLFWFWLPPPPLSFVAGKRFINKPSNMIVCSICGNNFINYRRNKYRSYKGEAGWLELLLYFGENFFLLYFLYFLPSREIFSPFLPFYQFFPHFLLDLWKYNFINYRSSRVTRITLIIWGNFLFWSIIPSREIFSLFLPIFSAF
jgi:hypothetical protein